MTVVGDELTGDVGGELAGNRKTNARCSGTTETTLRWLQSDQGRYADDLAG
jgi:hypothetical protein